jgi:alpha-L-fucosidase 2
VARDYYRMRGLRFPHMGSIGGHELNPPNMLMTDPGGTPWIAQLFWQYYEYSQDRAWLETEGYPILRDAALFCADYLTRDERGRWTIAPALHFEVRTYSADARPPKPPPFEMWGTNSLYGQAMFRMAFTQAIRAARELGVDERLCREWQEKLDGLAPPPSSPAGYWKAWENREPVYGWHNFLLPLAFPAELVSRFHGPPEWLERSRATWRHLRDHDLAANTGKAWVGGQGICELHRIGAVEEAFRGARWPARRPREGRRAGIPVPAGMLVRADEQQENGLSANPAAPVLQADHGAGMCRVLADMLVLGVDGTIHVFSGIPADVPARFFSLRAPGGFLLSGEKRGAKPDYVLVTPTAARPFRLGNVWGGAVAVTDLASGRLLRTTAEPVVAADLAVGREYLVASSGFRMEDLPRQDFAL